MIATKKHDLYALFAFALRENDWGLADAIASWLLDLDRDPVRLEAIVDRASRRPGAPVTLGELEHWATLAGELDQRDEFV